MTDRTTGTTLARPDAGVVPGHLRRLPVRRASGTQRLATVIDPSTST